MRTKQIALLAGLLLVCGLVVGTGSVTAKRTCGGDVDHDCSWCYEETNKGGCDASMDCIVYVAAAGCHNAY
jgi:hypothetical protein